MTTDELVAQRAVLYLVEQCGWPREVAERARLEVAPGPAPGLVQVSAHGRRMIEPPVPWLGAQVGPCWAGFAVSERAWEDPVAEGESMPELLSREEWERETDVALRARGSSLAEWITRGFQVVRCAEIPCGYEGCAGWRLFFDMHRPDAFDLLIMGGSRPRLPG